MKRWSSWHVPPQMVPFGLHWASEPVNPDHCVRFAFAEDAAGHHFRRCTFPDGSAVYSGLKYVQVTDDEASATERTAKALLGIRQGRR